jgi:NAD(P)-dependent dehydrogenase (short-subunit alcohol dehydrogenase family)
VSELAALKNMSKLNGKVAVIIGGRSGIGLATAHKTQEDTDAMRAMHIKMTPMGRLGLAEEMAPRSSTSPQTRAASPRASTWSPTAVCRSFDDRH